MTSSGYSSKLFVWLVSCCTDYCNFPQNIIDELMNWGKRIIIDRLTANNNNLGYLWRWPPNNVEQTLSLATNFDVTVNRSSFVSAPWRWPGDDQAMTSKVFVISHCSTPRLLMTGWGQGGEVVRNLILTSLISTNAWSRVDEVMIWLSVGSWKNETTKIVLFGHGKFVRTISTKSECSMWC